MKNTEFFLRAGIYELLHLYSSFSRTFIWGFWSEEEIDIRVIYDAGNPDSV